MRNETEESELEDMLTELDPQYESKEESKKIGRMLDQYGIPFFYRPATIIYREGKNEIWKPSFPVYPYGGLVIDYIPGSDQGRNDELLRKEQIYRYNQIPAVLLGPKDLTEPNWEELLYGRIERTYRQEFDPMRYTQAPAEK
ncbi:MAG TPA: hypothetical protein VMW24_12445 [Sedimentisphaerales bacterium]|nr:hypothetical protein [Sedimentisphaerales bacterium]